MNTEAIEARDRLDRAQQELASATAENEKHRRADLIGQLAAVRAELRQARARHQELVQLIHRHREDKDNAQRKVSAVLMQLGESQRASPTAADYLPDDPEVAAWTNGHEALENKLAGLIVERDKLPNPELTVIEANRYEGFSGLIATLQFTESNLLRALEGRGGIVPVEGGVEGVR